MRAGAHLFIDRAMMIEGRAGRWWTLRIGGQEQFHDDRWWLAYPIQPSLFNYIW